MKKLAKFFLAAAMLAAIPWSCSFGEKVAAAARDVIGLTDYKITAGEFISRDKVRGCDIDIRHAFSPNLPMFAKIKADKTHEFSSSPGEPFLVQVESLLLFHREAGAPKSQVPKFARFVTDPFSSITDSNQVEITFEDGSYKVYSGLKNLSFTVSNEKGTALYGIKAVVQRFGVFDEAPNICTGN